MAIVIANDNILSVRIGYSVVGATDVAYNILHYKVSSSAGAAPSIGTAMAAVALAMFTKWFALWKTSAGTDVQMDAVSVADVFPLPRSVRSTYVPGAPAIGTGGGEALPLQDAPTLLKTTDVGNRWGMGRLFYVGLCEAFQDSGEVTVGQRAALNAMGAALADVVPVTSGGWTANLIPVLLSGPEDNPTRITQITGGRLSGSVIKGQKRRRPGKGT